MATPRHRAVIDANQAAADVAYRLSQVIAIYPITPASAMGELADSWAAHGRLNLFGERPSVVEMQSEAGAAGAVHGALLGGALATTFTASQGLLLMLPEMYKIAGELLPFCMHVAARTLATHALSIFCDHSDVMACRGTGFALLCSSNGQEAHDMAAVAHAATLRSRVPFVHFFDGFRTSHELSKVEILTDTDLASLIDPELCRAHRARALDPEHPVIRGTAQNPDAFFQAREAINPFYDACASVVERELDRFGALTGRRYRLFEYAGHPEPEYVIISMGSGANTVAETARFLAATGRRVGALEVRLYRPFSAEALIAALPPSTRRIAVLDRTKEPGALGEPLLADVVLALSEQRSGNMPLVIGGRYGLSSKELTPAMVRASFDALASERPPRRFTLGIVDDVSGLSLPTGPELDLLGDEVYEAVFWGLGSDGTVGANKSTIQIIGEEAGREVQAYFVYDSKKSGAVTVSHLRFSDREIRAPYLIGQADFVACHQFEFLARYDVLAHAKPGATLLLNAPYPADRVWSELPRPVQQAIVEKRLHCWVIDAGKIARENALGRRINTVMQACFFALAKLLPDDQASAAIERMIEKSYAKRGPEVVAQNLAAVRAAREHLYELVVGEPNGPGVREQLPGVTGMLLAGKGDLLPVSAFPVDGAWPLGTARFEKRNLAHEIPEWHTDTCIQCNKCALVCPHAAIRAKVYDPELLADAPEGFVSTTWKAGELAGRAYTLQVAPEDCTGCALCVEVCPTKQKSLTMVDQRARLEREREAFDFFLELPDAPREKLHLDVKQSQLMAPLFEFSGACSGCGETPYIKLVTQLFGDRALIANATGCSSIFGGNLPTTPYTTNRDGRGPAWANSLFEDNAEFGFGLRLAVDSQRQTAEGLLRALASEIGEALVDALLSADQSSEAGIAAQRERVAEIRSRLASSEDARARQLADLADQLVKRSIWLVGGDGWAYDIGFGGLDHVLAQDRDINVLVLDSEVYSNTGGQQSKATPLGASAKFASSGKRSGKKDLGLIAMSYGHVYVARVAFGAKDAQTLRALVEADAHPGPSLVIGYSHCIAHGYDLVHGLEQQKRAVDSGAWPLYRFDPKRIERGEPPLCLDSGAPRASLAEYMSKEGRFASVEREDHERYAALLERAERGVRRRNALYQHLAGLRLPAE